MIMVLTLKVLFLWILLQNGCSEATPGLVLPRERTTGLGCIPEGRTVSYRCFVEDSTNPPIGSTIWRGSAFDCFDSSNRIVLTHSRFGGVISSCGSLRAMALKVNGSIFESQLNVTASNELNGTTISCSLSGTVEIGSDTLFYGAPPPPPGPLMVTLSSGSLLTVSWSPPSGPVEGGVGGYVFDVTGEGCGCMSMNISGNTTNVTCSGWTAAGQTCSFEVRTLSQDCGYSSSPLKEEITLVFCDPADLGDIVTSSNGPREVPILNGVIQYNGIVTNSTAVLLCDTGYTPQNGSNNRICESDGNWSRSEVAQTCVPISGPSMQLDLGYIAVFCVPILLTVAGLIAIGASVKHQKHKDVEHVSPHDQVEKPSENKKDVELVSTQVEKSSEDKKHPPDTIPSPHITPPVITSQPKSVCVARGETAKFTVEASGEGLTYTWFGPGGIALVEKLGERCGADSSTLTIPNAQSDDLFGDYKVHVTNSENIVTESDVVTLTMEHVIKVGKFGPGYFVTMVYTVPSTRTIDFKCGNDTPLHILYDEKALILNSCKNGQWKTPSRSHLDQGQHTKITALAKEQSVDIFANEFSYFFNNRYDLNEIDCIRFIGNGIPIIGKVLPNFEINKLVKITGIAPTQGQFSINFVASSLKNYRKENIPLHMRFECPGTIVRKTMVNGKWEGRQKSGGFLLNAGKDFSIAVVAQSKEFGVTVNGKHFSYTYRSEFITDCKNMCVEITGIDSSVKIDYV